MKKALVLLSIVCLVVGLAIPAAAQKKPFDGVTLRVFANSHDPMLKAVKWSIAAAKEKLGIDILMDEAAYGVQYEKATSAFASGAGQYDIIVAAHQWTGGWAEAGYLAPLDPFIKADKDFDPGIYNQKIGRAHV
jgi:ABC-type glycerol-3-phosphate transport system substrate-binding protein